MRKLAIVVACVVGGLGGCGGERGGPGDGSVGTGAAPVADAGEDQRTATGVPVVLDGTRSHDPEGAALEFAWQVVERPVGSVAMLAEADTAFPRLVPDVAGTYELSLVVSDGGSASAADVVQVEAVESGRFVPAFPGTGVIRDPRSGDQLYVPPSRRVHVWLMAEGYTSEDLAQFDLDVATWFEELREVDVYDAYREAFVIWKLPAVSAEHVPEDGGVADTAFRIPISAGGGSIDPAVRQSVEAAQRVWSYAPEFPFTPTFYPGSGRTAYQAKEIVVSMLVLHPGTGRSGFSGRGARFIDPEDSTRRLSAAIARDTTHEFSHAFARLADEYMGANDPPTRDNADVDSSSWIANVAKQPTCSTLPWRHLLAGTAINPSEGELVGAFGNDVDGYHPELRCLMNGTRTANADEFGGNGSLRSAGRLCNFCRELAVFRLMERTGVLPDTTSSWATWAEEYRTPFFDHHGFFVPSPVPQQNSAQEPVYRACTP